MRGPSRDAKNPTPVRERNTPERSRARAETRGRADSAASRRRAGGAPASADGPGCADMPFYKGRVLLCTDASRCASWRSSPPCPRPRRRRRRRPARSRDAGRWGGGRRRPVDRPDRPRAAPADRPPSAPASTSWAWDCWRQAARWASRSRFVSRDLSLGFRRGWTHGVLAMAVLAAGLTARVLAAARLAQHGRGFLMPFDGTWFYGDALFIIDFIIDPGVCCSPALRWCGSSATWANAAGWARPRRR